MGFKFLKRLIFLTVSIYITIHATDKYIHHLQNDMFKKGALVKPNNGEYRQFYENGQLYSIEHLKNGLKDGKCTFFYKSGEKKLIEHYKKNILEGQKKFFSQYGELIFIEKYKEGELVKTSVKNDSLYKYVVKILPHGKEQYDKLSWLMDNHVEMAQIKETIDIRISDLIQLKMDSVSACDLIFFSETLPLPDEKKFDLQYNLSLYDLKAILYYMDYSEREDMRKNKRIVRMPRYRRKFI